MKTKEILIVVIVLVFIGYFGFLVHKEAEYPCDQLQYMKPNLPERCMTD